MPDLPDRYPVGAPDEELEALVACTNALVKLDEDQLRRVLRYLRERFETEDE